MAVRIRLSRGGSKKRPFYRVVVADSRSPRDGRFIERLGSYNPLLPLDHAERLVLDVEKIKTWLSNGALPTERLQKLFSNLGLCAAPTFAAQTKQAQPRAKAQERLKEKAEKAAAAAEAAKQAAEAPASEEASAE
ncbi:MAG: 30S ribosomal protein S16 [Alphaproteobacteria bacterium]|nr:30S ribosomal protein S16 [Alphaproteobacteria bacterium]